jgi:rhamnogalacturonyl hydrolase YesR
MVLVRRHLHGAGDMVRHRAHPEDQRFRDYADGEFWATKNFLFDSQEHLFYRDSRFIGKTGAHGEKILWCRGNGWVLAGLVNILRELGPGDPLREKYVNLFVELANRVASPSSARTAFGPRRCSLHPTQVLRNPVAPVS